MLTPESVQVEGFVYVDFGCVANSTGAGGRSVVFVQLSYVLQIANLGTCS